MPEIDLAAAFGMAPVDAVAYFRQKGYTFSWDWQDTWQQAQARAFTVAKALRMDVLEDIRAAVDRALAEGRTYEQFRRGLEPELKRKGWWGRSLVGDGEGGARSVQLGSPWRLKTIYRTNLQTAYMAGRYKQQAEDVDNRPYWQYVAVLDTRTRPAHRALHGKVFAHDDAFWRAFYPPNGWGCRCRVRAVSAADLAARGLKAERSAGKLGRADALASKETGELAQVATYRALDPATGRPLAVAPDAGWSYNPGQAWLEPLTARPFDPQALPGGYKTVGQSFGPRPALERLPAKPLTDELLLPPHQQSGWSDERYIEAFLQKFGASIGRPAVISDPVGDALVISEQLFVDRAKGMFKVRRADRERYLPLLADTLLDPLEIWLTTVEKDGRRRLCKRYVGVYRGDGGRVGGFAVFDLVDGWWQGTTAFKPKNLGHLERQRNGVLLYAKKAKEADG